MELENLSDQEILAQTKFYVEQEKKYSSLVLKCLEENLKRKIYLERGHNSLFNFFVFMSLDSATARPTEELPLPKF